jgi:hypothetical protein
MSTHAVSGAHHIFGARPPWRAVLSACVAAAVLGDVCAAIYADAVLGATQARLARLEAQVGVSPYSPAAQR